jgi:phospholipid/cholesterol/gamma-HCH transport system substrate-binding protein
MQIRREEVRTGILVIVSIAILTGVLLAIGAPGVFKPTNTYYIYFDNAAGLNEGAPVNLAGRRIGQVTDLVSPVPMGERPKKEYEVRVQVEVDKNAQIFSRGMSVKMLQTSLLGQPVVDFTGGDENSSLAPSNSYFNGTREKDFTQAIADAVDVIQNTVTPVAVQAEKTMKELSATSDNLRRLTAPGSDVDVTVSELHKFADNLVEISATGGALQQSLANIEVLTGSNGHIYHALTNVDDLTEQLMSQNRVEKTLTNLQSATEGLDTMVNSLGPRVEIITANLQDATDTLKRQPWRLVWPSTKKYPSPSPAPKGRRL